MRTGEQIDRYELIAEIGRGGFGSIWRARHTVLGTEVALKVLLPNRAASADVIERFLREARAVAGVVSPYVVRVIDAGQTQPGSGRPAQLFLALELLTGEDLDARLQRQQALPPAEAVHIARQIAHGLEAAHAHGVIHRDLKPQNVFLAREPDGSVIAKLVDFGISKSHVPGHTEPAITQTGAVLGTPTYMAPEQLLGSTQVDARADIYALCVTLYEMLTDRLPYEAETLDRLIAMRLTEAPRPLTEVAPHLPAALIAIVQRGLEDKPDARWPSARALADALAQLGDLSQGSARTGPVGAVPELAAAARPAAMFGMASTAMATDAGALAGAQTGPMSAPSSQAPRAVPATGPLAGPHHAAAIATPARPTPSVPSGPSEAPRHTPIYGGASGSLAPHPSSTSVSAPGTLPPPQVGRMVRWMGFASAIGCIAVLAGTLAMIATAWVAASASRGTGTEAPPSVPAAPASPALTSEAPPAPALTAPPAPVPQPTAAPVAPQPGGESPAPASDDADRAPATSAGAVVATTHEAPPTPQPSTASARAFVVRALGAGPEAAGAALVRRASIAHCARPGVRDRVTIQMMFGFDGAVAVAQPDPNGPHGDESVAQCVAAALREAGPLQTDQPGGILIVQADF